MAIKTCLPVLRRKVHHAGRGEVPLEAPAWWPQGSPSLDPLPGSHFQSRSLASSVHCRHSGGPGSPIGSDS